MKTIEVDDELYQYIASQTRHIGESALKFPPPHSPLLSQKMLCLSRALLHK